MHPADLEPFTDMLDAVCSALSRGTYRASAANTGIYFRALQRYPLAVVRASFDAHVADPMRGRFVPVPADLIAQIDAMQADDGRLGAEEAWALALLSCDEAETVVWTTEIAQAFASARPVLEGGDEVGARMAFKEAYGRVVRLARAELAPMQWQASLGHDAARREAALAAAVREGRLLGGPATGHVSDVQALPAPRGPVLLLEAGASADDDSADLPNRAAAVAALQTLRERIASRAEGPSPDALAREATAAAKVEALRRAGSGR